jgi:hypothetical protein
VILALHLTPSVEMGIVASLEELSDKIDIIRGLVKNEINEAYIGQDEYIVIYNPEERSFRQ